MSWRDRLEELCRLAQKYRYAEQQEALTAMVAEIEAAERVAEAAYRALRERAQKEAPVRGNDGRGASGGI